MENADFSEALSLLNRMTVALEKMANIKNEPRSRIPPDDERAALAVVAIARGANSFAAIARELGISESTAKRNDGIRGALNMAVADRSTDQRVAEDFGWHQ